MIPYRQEKTEQEDSIAVSKSNIPKHLVAYVLKDRNCVVCSTSNNCTGCADRPFMHPRVGFYNINISNFIYSLFNMTYLIGYIVTFFYISIYILFEKLLPLL